jgi:hypothetical protein
VDFFATKKDKENLDAYYAKKYRHEKAQKGQKNGQKRTSLVILFPVEMRTISRIISLKCAANQTGTGKSASDEQSDGMKLRQTSARLIISTFRMLKFAF